LVCEEEQGRTGWPRWTRFHERSDRQHTTMMGKTG
jgi:hypothetical protein